MVLDGLEKEAQNIKKILDKGDVDLICHIVDASASGSQIYGRYYGAGLTSFDVAELEARKNKGQSIGYYSIRAELLTQQVPRFIDISDGSTTYRIKRKERCWFFRGYRYSVDRIEGSFMR